MIKCKLISQITTYRTIEQSTTSEFKDRGSRFLGYTFPIEKIEDVKRHMKALKELHPKAIHFCSAFRIGTNQNLYRASDDGEPSGSAGKPILGQIDSMAVTNVLVVVIRYWGGTLLGVPGLINAYKTAAHDALKQNTIIEKNIEARYLLQFNYTILNEVMRILKQYQITIYANEMALFCEYTIGIPLNQLEETLEKLGKLHELKVTLIESV